jgi:hypothetical protein
LQEWHFRPLKEHHSKNSKQSLCALNIYFDVIQIGQWYRKHEVWLEIMSQIVLDSFKF